MVINQPSGQIKLTNVSVIRLKKAKKRFEVACYQNKVQDYRNGVEKDLDEVLQIHQVFSNVSKGQVASKDDIQKAFNTTDTDVIIKEILSKGELQLSEKERQLQLSKITNEMLSLISAKCINPKSKKRYPPTMIHKALVELKFNPVPNKPAKLQALEAIKLLIAEQIIPIARSKMKVKVTVNLATTQSAEVVDKLKSIIKSADITESEGVSNIIGLIDPVAYRDLVAICEKTATLQVLDMAVIEESI